MKLWNSGTGALLRTLAGHQNFVDSVAFSPDGQTLASASPDKTVKLWNSGTGALLRTLAGHQGYVDSVAFSPDGQTLASASSDKTVKLWNSGTGALLRTLAGHQELCPVGGLQSGRTDPRLGGLGHDREALEPAHRHPPSHSHRPSRQRQFGGLQSGRTEPWLRGVRTVPSFCGVCPTVNSNPQHSSFRALSG